MARKRPSVFAGSSAAGIKIAKALRVLLDTNCEVTIWSQGVFGLSQGTLESLSRDQVSSAPRDNVLFELGFFIGGLGRDRTFIVYDRTALIKLPSDLAGVTAVTFEPHSSGNLQSALEATATQIEERIERLGLMDKERFRVLSEAAQELDSATFQMQRLIQLLARSRKWAFFK